MGAGMTVPSGHLMLWTPPRHLSRWGVCVKVAGALAGCYEGTQGAMVAMSGGNFGGSWLAGENTGGVLGAREKIWVKT